MNVPTSEPEANLPANNQPAAPTFAEALRFWLKLGFISFGGPTGQIAIMHAELVEKKRWISENRFLHALNYCMLLPGPEAQQLAIYVGWLLHRTWGGIVAGALFVLPSAFLLWALSFVYVIYGETAWVTAVFEGLKPAVLAIVAGAVLRIGKRALKNEVMWGLAALAFVGVFFFNVPFPVIVLTAGALGFSGGKCWPVKFVVISGHGSSKPEASVIRDNDPNSGHTKPSLFRALKVGVICLTLWWTPVLALGLWVGFDHVLVKQGLFFSKAAMVTFGGAYAVLPYVSQQAVGYYDWVTAGQMLDGLGLAETTPGPLIMVLQFVGFLGGWKFHAPFSPLATATLGAFITTWTTFLPCFLWIFLGAPHIEQLRNNQKLSAALSAITASVVGVILNLTVWFGLNVLIPSGQPVNWFGVAVCVVAFAGMVRWKWDIIPVVLGAGMLGVLWRIVLAQ
jgi:chromate transporter